MKHRATELLAAGLIISHCLALAGAWGAEEAEPRDSFVYTVRSGETIADVAARFLGDATCAPELLKYNSISNPLDVSEGSLLVIPGARREKARTAFDEATTALVKAREVACETFAPDAYAKAETAFQSARVAWNATAYLRAEGLCLLAIEQARRAIQLTEERSRVDRDATVLALHGKVEASVGKGEPWQAVQVGHKMTVRHRLRTERGARAKLGLPGGGTVQVGGATEVKVEELMEDQRSGQIRSRLRLFLGELLSEIETLKTEDSVFEVLSGEATTAIRGTEFSVSQDELDASRIVTFKGEVVAMVGDERQVVPANSGTLVKSGRRPMPAAELLPAPDMVSPGHEAFSTAAQRVDFAWHPVGARGVDRGRKSRHGLVRRPRSTEYRFEIAGDPEFITLVQEAYTRETELRSDLLEPGTYFWRLATVGEFSLQGPWSDTGRFTVQRDLNVDLVTGPALIQRGGVSLAGPGVTISLRPADADSSVHHYEYSINGGAFTESARGVEITRAGTYRVEARAVGEDGFAGAPVSTTFQLDAAAPRVEIHFGLPETDEQGRRIVLATVRAVDDTDVKRIEVSIDGGPFAIYEGPIALDATRDYMLAVKATDIVNNTSRPRKMQVFASE